MARRAMYGLSNHIQRLAPTKTSDTTHAAPGAAGGGSLPARRITRERSSSQDSAIAAATSASVMIAPESSVAWLGSSGAGGAAVPTPGSERIASRASPTPQGPVAAARHHHQPAPGLG